jgi:hypothetical protein
MKQSILKFGLISGVVSSLLMVVTIPFEDKIGFDRAEFVGYSVIVLSLLLVFFDIRSYRDHSGNGHITFVKGFAVGISITVISCIFYVVTWEVMYFKFMPDFMDKYGAHLIEKAKASGASAAALQTQLQQVQKYKALYDNPFTNAAMTFLEPFPVGLIITIISAAVLRTKSPSVSKQASVATS